EDLELGSVEAGIEAEVDAPDLVWCLGGKRDRAPGALLAIALHSAQFLLLPDPVDPLYVQRVELRPDQGVRHPVAHIRPPDRPEAIAQRCVPVLRDLER